MGKHGHANLPFKCEKNILLKATCKTVFANPPPWPLANEIMDYIEAERRRSNDVSALIVLPNWAKSTSRTKSYLLFKQLTAVEYS